MLIPILKARAVYHKTALEKAQKALKTQPLNSINWHIAQEAVISSRAAIAELIILQKEVHKLNFMQQ